MGADCPILSLKGQNQILCTMNMARITRVTCNSMLKGDEDLKFTNDNWINSLCKFFAISFILKFRFQKTPRIIYCIPFLEDLKKALKQALLDLQ